MDWTKEPFFVSTLPIVVTLTLGFLSQIAVLIAQNRRIDDLRQEMNRRFDELLGRLGRIDAIAENHERRITILEERTSPLTHR